MSAVYIQKLIEVVQEPKETLPLFALAPGAGDFVAVTGQSGLRTRIYMLGLSAEADVTDLLISVKNGTALLDQKLVPKKTLGDFEWNQQNTPWVLDAGEDFVIEKSIAPRSCRVSLKYDRVM